MKTEYKYIHFEAHRSGCEATKDDKPVYLCRNNKTNTVLGGIEYYPPWIEYGLEAKD